MSKLPIPNWQSERPYIPNSSVNNAQTERYRFALSYCINKEILDLFCGDGFGSEIISKTAKLVYGIDYSEEAIQYAKSLHQHSNITYLVDKFPPIRLADNSFDVVIGLEAIEHVENDKKFLEESRRVLRPEGFLIICTPIFNPKIGVGRWHAREYCENDFRNLLSSYFKIEKFINPFPGQKLMAVCQKK